MTPVKIASSWLDDDHHPGSVSALADEISAYGEQCRRAGAGAMREAATKVLENGSFLHDKSPSAIWAKQVAALIRALPPSAEAAAPAAGWLLERPQTPDRHADWWHPKHGWTRDANRGLRFARKEDAEAYRAEGRFTSDVVATEHLWVPSPSEEARKDK